MTCSVYSQNLLEQTPQEDVKKDKRDRQALSVKSVNDMTPRQRRNLKMFSTPLKHSSRGGSRKFMPEGPNADIFQGIDPEIFHRLGVEAIHPLFNSMARKDLVNKLVSAVKEDLDSTAQDEGEAIMRAEGFKRFAGKSAYELIIRRREDLDWATGQKKTPRGDEKDDIEMRMEAEEEQPFQEEKTSKRHETKVAPSKRKNDPKTRGTPAVRLTFNSNGANMVNISKCNFPSAEKKYPGFCILADDVWVKYDADCIDCSLGFDHFTHAY